MKGYLLIGGWKADIPIYKAEITQQDLIAIKKGDIDWLIDLEKGTYFDLKENKWREISK